MVGSQTGCARFGVASIRTNGSATTAGTIARMKISSIDDGEWLFGLCSKRLPHSQGGDQRQGGVGAEPDRDRHKEAKRAEADPVDGGERAHAADQKAHGIGRHGPQSITEALRRKVETYAKPVEAV